MSEAAPASTVSANKQCFKLAVDVNIMCYFVRIPFDDSS